MSYDPKIAKLYNNYYTFNTYLSLIIGSGNTKTDYTRHSRKYNIAIGGECDDTKEDLIAFGMYTGTKEFNDFISNIGQLINFVAIDFSVCAEFSFADLISILKNLQQDDLSVYIPLRNIKIDNRYLDTIHNSTQSSNMEYAQRHQNIIDIFTEQFSSTEYKLALYNDNNDLKYPIESYNHEWDNMVKSISYIHITKK